VGFRTDLDAAGVSPWAELSIWVQSVFVWLKEKGILKK
jgi:hypothetical protein